MKRSCTFFFLLILISCSNKDKEQKETSQKMASQLCECLQNDSSYTSCIMTLQESNPKYEELSQEQLMEEVNKNCPEKSKTINNTFVEAN